MSSPRDIDLEKIINKVLTEKAKNDIRDYSYFHPSEFYQCHRKLAYKFYEYHKLIIASNPSAALIDPQLQRIFDNGHYLHSRLRENLEASGILRGVWKCIHCSKVFGEEETFGVLKPSSCECGKKKFQYEELGFSNKETLLSGHVDAVVDLTLVEEYEGEDEESYLVIDFKSICSQAFRVLSAPKDSHFLQLQIYLYLSDLKTGKLLYENKDNQKFREFLVVRDDNFVQTKVIEPAKHLKKIVMNTNSGGKRTLPVRAHKHDYAKECVECTFRSHCWGLKK